MHLATPQTSYVEVVSFWKVSASCSSSELNTTSAFASWFYTIWVLKNKNFHYDKVFESIPFSGYFWDSSHLSLFLMCMITDYVEYFKILLERPCIFLRKRKLAFVTSSASNSGEKGPLLLPLQFLLPHHCLISNIDDQNVLIIWTVITLCNSLIWIVHKISMHPDQVFFCSPFLQQFWSM